MAKVFVYYVTHTVVNSIKKLFHTWVAVFLATMLLIGVAFGVGAVLLEDAFMEEDTSYTEEVVPEDEMTEADVQALLSVVEMGIFGVTLLVVLSSIYTGDKSGSSIFTMPDVNLLFTAPLVPQTVLLFRVLLQMGAILVGSLYLVFQIPTMINEFELSAMTILSVFLAWIVLLTVAKLISVCTYTLTSTYPKLKRMTKIIPVAVIALLGGLFYVTMTGKGLTPFSTAKLLFSGQTSRVVPLFGWMQGLIMHAAQGNLRYSFFYFLLLVALIVLFAFFIWKIKADFYEDAFSKAEKTQATLDAAMEGRSVRTKERTRTAQTDGLTRGTGAVMFLEKSLYNRRRFAFLGLFTKTATTYWLVSVGIAAITYFLFDSTNLVPLACILLVILFFCNYGNPLSEEADKHFLYMIPESPARKLLYAVLAGTAGTALDIVLPFTAAAVFLRTDVWTVLGWLFLFITFDFAASISGLLIEMLLPTSLHMMVKGLLQFWLKFIIAVPTVVLLIIGGISGALSVFLLIAALVNASVGLLLFTFCPSLLHAGHT